MDGNFKAEHMLLKQTTNEVWLMDGKGFMVTEEPYKTYLAATANWVEVCKARICLWKNLMPQIEIGL